MLLEKYTRPPTSSTKVVQYRAQKGNTNSPSLLFGPQRSLVVLYLGFS